MITVRIKGGLGNQMFQYAVGYALATQAADEVCFDPAFTPTMTARSYKLPLLRVQTANKANTSCLPTIAKVLKNPYINKACRMLKLGHHTSGDFLYYLEVDESFHPEVLELGGKNVYLDGYFQSPHYFESYRKELLTQLQPNYLPADSYMAQLAQIKSSCSVAVHVRRSDFKADRSPFHYLLAADYYREALAYMRAKLSVPEFFWFTDDFEWVKAHSPADKHTHFVELHTQHCDIDDMMLMKHCHHIITANSTFSWWAAWLNEHPDALIVVPGKPYGNPDMLPSSWIKL